MIHSESSQVILRGHLDGQSLSVEGLVDNGELGIVGLLEVHGVVLAFGEHLVEAAVEDQGEASRVPVLLVVVKDRWLLDGGVDFKTRFEVG
jgi:hypothetical protein